MANPTLDLDANNSTGGGADATATYTAGGPAKSVTDTDVTIASDSGTIQSATVTILGWALHAGDTLSVIGALPGGIAASAYDPATGVITLTGPASTADYQTALRLIGYSSTDAAPSTADRGITVTVNDGVLTSNVATMYMHVASAPANIAPVLDLDANDSTTPGANYLTGFTEGGPPAAIVDTDVSIIDADSANLASATITLTNPQTDDVLTFDGPAPSGIAVSGSGTAAITLTGIASPADYQLALQQIHFANGNVDPSNVTRTIEIAVNDGTSNSNVALSFVQVEAVDNSAPVIDLDPDDSGGSVRSTFRTTFTENGTPLPIVDTDISITDLDSTTLVSATITLVNPQAGDLLNVTLPLPGGISASSYDPGTGVLTLTGIATLDEYEAALRRVLYSNTSEDPATVDRLIAVVVNDGANDSNVAAALIGVAAVNDAPTLAVDAAANYVENAAPVTLSPLATLGDVDDTDLNGAVVRITSGEIAGDGDTLTVGGLASGTVNGITFLWHPVEHAMVFMGASSIANYQDLLRTIEFHSTSDNPTDFDASLARTLTWSISDGTAVTTATTTLNIDASNDPPVNTVPGPQSVNEDTPLPIAGVSVADPDAGSLTTTLTVLNGTLIVTGTGVTGSGTGTVTIAGTIADINAALATLNYTGNPDFNGSDTLTVTTDDGTAQDTDTVAITVNPLNDPPVNTVPGAQSASEDTALAIAGLSAADIDSPTLTTTLTVTNGTLSIVSGTASITGNLTGTVTISGTVADVNAALAGVNYLGNPDFNGTDTLTMRTSDGSLFDEDTVAITVAAVADGPSIDLDADNSSGAPGSGNIVVFTENGPPVLLADIDMTLTDDDSNLVGATFLLLNSRPDDGLLVNGALPAGITATVAGNQLTLSGSAPLADYEAAIHLIAFNNTGDAPDLQSRIVLVQVDDGAATANAFVIVQVIGVDDVPVAQDGSASGDEDHPIAGTLVATDSDTPTLTYALVAQAAHGSVAIGPGGAYTYTPASDFNGSDSFTFVANDGTTDSNVATVTLAVSPVDDRPIPFGSGTSPDNPTGFDAAFYLATNPDVAASGADPLQHFNTVGWREGRDPSADFDTSYYLAQNPDVAAAGVNPLDHFNSAGWREGRDPNAYFDTIGYLAQNPDVAVAGVNPLEHYETFGWHEGRDPSLAFDTTQYLAVYTDVAAANTDPLGHFLYFGIREGRSAFGDGFWE